MAMSNAVYITAHCVRQVIWAEPARLRYLRSFDGTVTRTMHCVPPSRIYSDGAQSYALGLAELNLHERHPEH